MSVTVNKAFDTERLFYGLVLLMAIEGKELEGEMKANAPWKDRTGTARQSLHATTIVERKQVTLRLSHGVDYGIHLELGHAGRYAILKPTIDKHRTEIRRMVESLFR